MDFLEEAELRMAEAIEAMEKRFLNVRAGRANPSILDKVMVNYYGTDTPLKTLANISVPEARELMIKPFDRSLLSAIEKGLTPNNNGEVIILVIPALTEETRREYVKQVKSMSEDARISLRGIRQDINNEIKKAELTDDDKKAYEEDIQELINKYNKIVDEKTKAKETELMTV